MTILIVDDDPRLRDLVRIALERAGFATIAAADGRAALIVALWGAHSPVSDRTLDSHLRNLRRKLADAGCGDAIETVHGQGMRLGACG